MGLMLEISRGLSISETRVGHLISAYAIGVVVGAPLLALPVPVMRGARCCWA